MAKKYDMTWKAEYDLSWIANLPEINPRIVYEASELDAVRERLRAALCDYASKSAELSERMATLYTAKEIRQAKKDT